MLVKSSTAKHHEIGSHFFIPHQTSWIIHRLRPRRKLVPIWFSIHDCVNSKLCLVSLLLHKRQCWYTVSLAPASMYRNLLVIWIGIFNKITPGVWLTLMLALISCLCLSNLFCQLSWIRGFGFMQRLFQIWRFSQLMCWRQKHLLCPSRNQFRRVCSKSPPLPHPPLPQKAIMVSEIRGSTPLKMSTSRPSLCCRLSQNESVQFSPTMETAGLCLWPICFPSLLKSAWLN